MAVLNGRVSKPQPPSSRSRSTSSKSCDKRLLDAAEVADTTVTTHLAGDTSPARSTKRQRSGADIDPASDSDASPAKRARLAPPQDQLSTLDATTEQLDKVGSFQLPVACRNEPT
jgi:hypothetical protein